MKFSAPKWSTRGEKINIHNVPNILPPGIKPPNLQAILLRAQYEEIQYKLSSLSTEAKTILDFNDQSPKSSANLYNQRGVKDSVQSKARDILFQERKALIDSIDKFYPVFRIPASVRIAYTKCTKKFYIPSPNFIGQILGPRGETLKQLESKYNVKISIRGKGSTPDTKGSAEVYTPRSPDEPLHALIEAENEQSIENVAKILEEIVTPKPDKENELKKAQLRQLAVYNGVIPATPVKKAQPKVEKPPPWFDPTLNLGSVEVDNAVDKLIDGDKNETNQEFIPGNKIRFTEKMKKLTIDLKNHDISTILPKRLPPGM